MNFLKNKTILITGGTGSFGEEATKFLLKNTKIKKIIIFSRDENKQFIMQNKFKDRRIRFFIGDVRDEDRLDMALRNVNYVVHAAALKHVPIAEYNPIECVKTNIYGTQALVTSSIKNKVEKIIGLSTDKACNPINLYGATKLCAEKILINANYLSGKNGSIFGVVRYGNVLSSRGSIIPYIRELIKIKSKFIPLTDMEMTRFFLPIDSAIKFVFTSLEKLSGGEIYVPKMFSMRIYDLIKLINKKIKIKIIGKRPGEKINETLISIDESENTKEYKNFYIIYPPNSIPLKKGVKLPKDFSYSSNQSKILNIEFFKKIIASKKI
jgi:UDP-N-acetylglucosamine 4,6-dehydratase